MVSSGTQVRSTQTTQVATLTQKMQGESSNAAAAMQTRNGAVINSINDICKLGIASAKEFAILHLLTV